MRKNKGFTLIELLVVIAIIGILSSIVLVSMNSTRNKAKDARVQADMAQVRTLAESLYDGSTYPGTFVTPANEDVGCTKVTAVDSNLYALASDTVAQIPVSTCVGSADELIITKCATNSKYVASIKLPTGTYWCVDSSGISKGGYSSRALAEDTTNCVCK